MKAALLVPVLALVMVGGGAAAALAYSHAGPGADPGRAEGLRATLSCTAGGQCVYTLRNPGRLTSYIPYASTGFAWGSAHFAGGGCLAPGGSLRQVAYTHDGHGGPVAAGATVRRSFTLPYKPHDNRCPS